jgi:hypothetical protein
MAQTFYSQNLAMLKEAQKELDSVNVTTAMDGNEYLATYIGSYLSLDPCGRYHHILSLNGVTSRCEAYWESLEKAATRLGGWIESGEGDPLDQYYCECLPEEQEPDALGLLTATFTALNNLSGALSEHTHGHDNASEIAIAVLESALDEARDTSNSAYFALKPYLEENSPAIRRAVRDYLGQP